MQVASALTTCLPGRVLSSILLAASQHAAIPHQLWQHPLPTTQQPQQSSFNSTNSSRSRLQHLAHFSSSSSSSQHSSGKQEGPSQEAQDSSSSRSSSDGDKHPHVNVQEEAKQAAKGMLAKNLDMEELWFAAVGGKLKVWSARSHPDLKGREEEIVSKVKDAYYDTFQRAVTGHLLSSRSRNQMKQACLAASTYKTLVDSVPGTEAASEQFIADLMGGLYAPFMLGGLKVSSWVKRVLLRQSSISQAVDTLHTITRDMEGACHCSVQPLSCGSDSEAEDAGAQEPAAPAAGATSSDLQQQEQQQRRTAEQEEEHEKEDEAEATAAAQAAAQHHTQKEWQLGAALTVDSCLYAEVLAAEGVPQLLKSFCCQHNMSWLGTYSSQGVDSHLEACIAKGGGCCRVTVTPAEKS